MFSGPMFRWEYRSATRRRRQTLLRVVLGALLGLAVLLMTYSVYSASSRIGMPDRMLYLGRSLLIATMVVELLFLLFFVPTQVSPAIAEERSKDTLSMLLLTRLTPIEIVLTKALGRWLPAANMVLTGLPVLVAAAWLGGMELESAMALLVLLSCSALMAALTMLSSAQHENVSAARGQAVAGIFGWLVGLPVMSVIPVTVGSFWADLLYEVKTICGYLAPSSPVSLLTDRSWYYGTSPIRLEGRVAIMVGLQAVFVVLALNSAAGRLQAREKNPNWLDPTKGHRPRCGDDPIFWREYDMPMRTGAGSLLGIRLRYLWILIRAIWINVRALLFTMLALGVPAGLLVGLLYYGQAAFRELWSHGYGPTGPFVDRGYFNYLIRAATGMLGLFPIVGLAATIVGRITVERDKKTWDVFLTTPLDASEVLRSKARVALRWIWQSAKPLPILWAIGLAIGVITPFGLTIAVVDLLLLTWASVAIGLYLGFRPGTSANANSYAATIMLVAMVLHTPLLYALLASPRELAIFGTWSAVLRWSLILGCLSVTVLTAVTAWFFTRRTIDRFDEWMGRPIAGAGERGHDLRPDLVAKDRS